MATNPISVTLTGEAAKRVERLIQSGEYPTAEAAIEDALAALDGEPSNLDAWLDQVGARYDEYKSDPSEVVSLEELRRRLALGR